MKELRRLVGWAARKPRWLRVPVYAGLALGIALYALKDTAWKEPALAYCHERIVYAVEAILPNALVAPRDLAEGAAGHSGVLEKPFVVAVARLGGDLDGDVQQHLLAALAGSGIKTFPVERRLRLTASYSPTEERQATHTARGWLELCQADVLVWGQIAPGGKIIRLFFTPRNALSPDGVRVEKSAINKTLQTDKDVDYNGVIRAQLLGILAGFDPSHSLDPKLRTQIERVEQMLAQRAPGEASAALGFALAQAKAVLGEQQGDPRLLRQAVAAYQTLAQDRSAPGPALFPAKVQNNLGNALGSLATLLAEPDRSATREKALRAYAAAAQAYRSDGWLEDWAITQNNRGETLRQLGRLEEAGAVFEQAMAALPGNASAADRALLEHNLGNVLVMAAQADPTDKALAQLKLAVVHFENASRIRVRAEVPLSWAMTREGLGNALGVLGERIQGSPGDGPLAAAIAAYEEALQEYTADRPWLARDRARTQRNLGLALNALGRREKSVARLTAAVAAFRSALELTKKSGGDTATLERNVGAALRDLAELRLEQAVADYRGAVVHFGNAADPIERAMTHYAIGRTLALLSERDRSYEQLEAAIAEFQTARAIPEFQAEPEQRDVANSLWAAESKASAWLAAKKGERASAP